MAVCQTALQNLLEARRLIRRGWSVGAFARDCAGEECSPRSPEAVSFCAWGAVTHANGPGEAEALMLLRPAAKEVGSFRGNPQPHMIFTINDKRGLKSVLKMFELAIAAAKK